MKDMRLFILSCLALLAAPSGALAQRQQYPVELTSIRDTKTFPVIAAGYGRGKMVIYQPDRLNFSVAYDAIEPNHKNSVTIFFYAETAAMELQFEREKKQITGAHEGTTLLHENTVSFNKNGSSFSGYVAQYRYNGVFAQQQQELFSELILIKLSDRYVKVRSTTPSSQASIAQTNTRKLLDVINWAP